MRIPAVKACLNGSRALEATVARGRDVRVGLEDVLTLPDGRPARDNAELVAAAVALAAGRKGSGRK